MNKSHKLTFGQIFLVAVLGVLVTSTAVSGAIAYAVYQQSQVSYDASASSDLVSSTATSQSDQYLSLDSKVRSMILITTDEAPRITMITNIEQHRLGNPSFYAEAQNGDFVLFYSSKVVIFREAPELIVNVSSVIN